MTPSLTLHAHFTAKVALNTSSFGYQNSPLLLAHFFYSPCSIFWFSVGLSATYLAELVRINCCHKMWHSVHSSLSLSLKISSKCQWQVWHIYLDDTKDAQRPTGRSLDEVKIRRRAGVPCSVTEHGTPALLFLFGFTYWSLGYWYAARLTLAPSSSLMSKCSIFDVLEGDCTNMLHG